MISEAPITEPFIQTPELSLQLHMAGLPYHPSYIPENFTIPAPSHIVVRTEEAVIVVLVLILWVAAIALFFNRWGKIRMLEPYQPKFIQQHRPSCPLVESVQQHRSFSKYNLNPVGAGTTSATATATITSPPHLRARQNSVFVGSSMVTLPFNATRRVRSAVDLQNLQYLLFSDPALNRHHIQEFRRSSMLCGLERVQCHADPTSLGSRRRSSIFDNSKRATDMRRGSFMVDCEKPPLPGHRRASALTGGDPERGFVAPRPSGVLDFRRNSMLILNNLTEEVPPFQPCLRTLNVSHMNLNTELRRNSVIPSKPMKSKSLSTTEKHMTNQKATKSLDLEAGGRKSSMPITELRRQFLNTDSPLIVETRCSTPGGNETVTMDGVAEEGAVYILAAAEDNIQVQISADYGDGNPKGSIAILQPIVKSTNV